MRLLDKATSAALVKLIIFMVITTMATAVLVVLIGNLTFQSSRDYKADFTDVTGVVKGDDVKGCKGDVWVSNGLGMWENNCARGQACCDLAARYDHKTRGAKKQ